ncbi:hypothetical protein Tco_1527031 [Tanacetum coccineum]
MLGVKGRRGLVSPKKRQRSFSPRKGRVPMSERVFNPTPITQFNPVTNIVKLVVMTEDADIVKENPVIVNQKMAAVVKDPLSVNKEALVDKASVLSVTKTNVLTQLENAPDVENSTPDVGKSNFSRSLFKRFFFAPVIAFSRSLFNCSHFFKCSPLFTAFVGFCISISLVFVIEKIPSITSPVSLEGGFGISAFTFWRPNFKENVPIYTLYLWRYFSPMSSLAVQTWLSGTNFAWSVLTLSKQRMNNVSIRNASAPSVTLLSDYLNLLKAFTSITSS